MYSYPLTISFPLFSITPQVEVKDASGKALFSAAKKLISSKDEINVSAGGQPAFKIISQENRITDIPSNWDVVAADGRTLGVIDDDFISAIDTSKFVPSGAGRMLVNMELSRALNLRAIKMYWIKDTGGKKVGFVAPEKESLMTMQLPLGQFVRQVPFLSRFITPHYYVRLGEETVMYMEKQRTLFQDVYKLQARGKFSDAQEPLLLNGVLLAVLYERDRLKELYS
jgi:uncharacterized protein YxjI